MKLVNNFGRFNKFSSLPRATGRNVEFATVERYHSQIDIMAGYKRLTQRFCGRERNMVTDHE